MPANNPTPPSSAKSPNRRRRWYILAAIVCGLVPVIALEAGLRLAGVGEERASQDPLVGFSRVAPLFEPDEQGGVYRTARSRQVLFEQQEFAIDKPVGGIRIFCLGGSTVRGRPYTAETAFARWLQLELSARDPDHTYEVVNCGGLSYASYRLTHILQEVLDYDPDLIVIATGHNEFLEDRTYGDLRDRSPAWSWLEDRLHRLRTVQLVRELMLAEPGVPPDDGRTVLPELVEARLDQASGYASYHRDDDWSRSVHEHFEQSLQAMLRRCRQANVPALLVRLGSNLRDCPPFKSEHRPGLKLEDERQWQSHVEQAQALEESDPGQALIHYEAAAGIDDQHALLRFRLARLLDRLGRTDEAAGHYLAAKDLDVCPLRMPEAFAASLRQIAEQTATNLVDARGLIESECDASLPGNDWYLDHVHPSIGAHQRIGRAIATEAADLLSVVTLADWNEDDRRALWRRHLDSLGPIYLASGHERVRWLEKWARRQRLLEETLPRDPAAHIRYGHRLWDFGRQQDAWEQYQSALETDPSRADALRQRSLQLFEQGREQEASALLQRLEEGELIPADQLRSIRSRILSDN